MVFLNISVAVMSVFERKNKALRLNRTQALNCSPIKNTRVKATRLDTGEVLLTYPITIRPWIRTLARRLGRDVNQVQLKKLQLDELGTAVWDLIDGKRSVRQIIKRFVKRYHLQTREAEVAVTRFVRMLGKRGLIGLK